MSYAPNYPRRPSYSNVGYGNTGYTNVGYNNAGYNNAGYNNAGYGNAYGPNYANNQYDYEDYQQPAYPSGSRRRNSYYPRGSRVQYADGAQYITTGGRDHYPSNGYSSRYGPNVVVASDRHGYARPVTPYVSNSTSSRYRAEGDRGEVPVIAGVSYRDEGVPLSTRIRRLFGIGPKRSRSHRGQAIHVKRWGFGPNFSRRQYSTADYGNARRSSDTVYTV